MTACEGGHVAHCWRSREAAESHAWLATAGEGREAKKQARLMPMVAESRGGGEAARLQ